VSWDVVFPFLGFHIVCLQSASSIDVLQEVDDVPNSSNLIDHSGF
jgi:hypothetical protein